jgi:RNA polymerase sigma factor (sigma-70 family)
MEANSVSRTPTVSLPRSRRLLAALSDDRLVEHVRRGSDAAFEAIYDRHSGGILAFCRHMLASADEAEDAVQHTFIQAYGALRRSDRDIRLKAWLYTIARNRCISILRARREQATELGDLPTAGLSDEVQRRSELRELLADIRDLPEKQRAALVLSEVGDLSHSDIATVVGCDVKKVKALVFQARSSLIETRNARAIPCSEIREQLATGSGGALRRGPLRRHVKQCRGCSEFRDEVQAQRRLLAIALPVAPSLALKKSALAAIGIGGGGAAGGAAGGVAGGGLASLIGSTGATKAVAVVALAGATAAGGLVLSEQGGRAQPGGPGATAPEKSIGATGGEAISRFQDVRDKAAGRDAASRPAAGTEGRREGRAGDKSERRPGARPGSPQPGKSGGRMNHGRSGSRGNGSPPSTDPAHPNNTAPNGNANGGGSSNAGGNGGGNAGGNANGNNGRHLGAVNGNGSGNGYGHQGTPAQPAPPAKPERTPPAAEPAPPTKPEKPEKASEDTTTD